MPVDYADHDFECGYMWAATAGGLRGEHSCIEVGEHDVHRCCCNAKTLRNTAASVAINGAGDREGSGSDRGASPG